ncbi:hypothetical protein MIT9_P2059 [Methylomarinovum caldicuralii]|uniref:BLUF domain-containing protein n=1 Tax=Methylomarinovum caldicuralii TaxID=438856 RepID=A0AAU9BU55_9GAMM|nr:BLUF domain-containing protein [Methylomarinovum caldicuralii]BCX82473.1 hypothetical protein MIT9_P2059 [Methylomarinovum caldicuralii]
MIRLSYISQAARAFGDEELDAMLEKFRANNRARDISGVLYQGNGMFMQVLEGPKEAVEETFRRIRKDPRHHDVHLIEKTPIEKRRFGDFGMAFNRLRDEDFRTLAQEMGASEKILKRQQTLIEGMSHKLKEEADRRASHMELPLHHEDRLIRSLHHVIHVAVKGLAVLMTMVIV